ncbi:MAG: hypothetical protein KAR35_00265 [Candidatus Heimdallarchaeota archaeon]|nr:hypothetical protein [Candidatus Heimdallarchaeota archaeon]MCK5047784.1 hypothetical protein [Candidatus Heimdallarchaeota archaeon]
MSNILKSVKQKFLNAFDSISLKVALLVQALTIGMINLGTELVSLVSGQPGTYFYPFFYDFSIGVIFSLLVPYINIFSVIESLGIIAGLSLIVFPWFLTGAFIGYRYGQHGARGIQLAFFLPFLIILFVILQIIISMMLTSLLTNPASLLSYIEQIIYILLALTITLIFPAILTLLPGLIGHSIGKRFSMVSVPSFITHFQQKRSFELVSDPEYRKYLDSPPEIHIYQPHYQLGEKRI